MLIFSRINLQALPDKYEGRIANYRGFGPKNAQKMPKMAK